MANSAKKKKYIFFNINVTILFSRFEELSKDEKNGIDFQKMLRDIEEAQKKDNFVKIFQEIVSKNLDKVLVAQAKAIKDGKSDISLSKMCRYFVNTMRSIEKICIDRRILKSEALSSIFDEKKLRNTMTDIVKRELMGKDNKPTEKLDAELKEIATFKLDKISPSMQINKPHEAIRNSIIAIAEKKFGKKDDSNKEQIEKFVEEFDITNPEYQKDFNKFADSEQIIRNSLGFVINPKTGLPYITDLYYQYFLAYGRKAYFDFYFGDPNSPPMNRGFYSKPHVDSKLYNDITNLWFNNYCNIYFNKPLESANEPKADCPYFGELNRFKEHFGFDVNTELLADMLHDTVGVDEGKDIYYRHAYLDTFIRLFEKTDGGYKNVCQLTYDYEDLMQAMIKNEAPELSGPEYKYGGLSIDEMKDFLVNLTEAECNITKKTKKELESKCSIVGVLPVKDVIKFSKDKINDVKEQENMSKDEKLINSIAMLTALQQVHNERQSGFSFFHPLLYREETRAINELKKEVMALSGTNMTKDMMDSMNNGRDIYSEGYQQALKDIKDFGVMKEPIKDIEKNTKIEKNAPVSVKKIDDPNKEKIIEIKAPEIPELKKHNND